MNLGNYAEALEQQVAMLHFVASAAGQAILSESASRTNNDRLQIVAAHAAVLQSAEPFYWSRSLCDLLSQTAPAMPAWTLTDGAWPTRCGWCWFSKPLPLMPWDGEPCPLTAFAWMEVSPGVLRLLIYVGQSYRPQGVPTDVLDWRIGWRAEDVMAAVPTPIIHPFRTAEKLRYVAAAFAFMQQRILVSRQERAERHARKRLERQGWTHEPLIRVVQLRARESGYQERDGTAAHVDWSCRWIVRGHWRQQPSGPNRQNRNPIWIAPHLKGPEDKPLKAPHATVFAVVR